MINSLLHSNNKYNYILFISILLFTVSCKKKNSDPSLQEQALNQLQGSWTVVEVRKDDTIITDFQDFTITFTNSEFSTTNGSPVWPSAASFVFADEQTITNLRLQNARSLEAVLNDNILILSIAYEQSNARGIEGDYVFTLKAL